MKTLMLSTSLASLALCVPFSDVLPTMEIVTEAGPVTINVTDFDSTKHTPVNKGDVPAAPDAAPVSQPANEPPTPAPAPPAPPAPPSNTPPAPAQKFVTKTGKKFFLTDADGKVLDAAHPGYDTEAEAQAASKL